MHLQLRWSCIDDSVTAVFTSHSYIIPISRMHGALHQCQRASSAEKDEKKKQIDRTPTGRTLVSIRENPPSSAGISSGRSGPDAIGLGIRLLHWSAGCLPSSDPVAPTQGRDSEAIGRMTQMIKSGLNLKHIQLNFGCC